MKFVFYTVSLLILGVNLCMDSHANDTVSLSSNLNQVEEEVNDINEEDCDIFDDEDPDPFERWNRAMFAFNNTVDEKILQRISPTNKDSIISKVFRNFSFNFFEPSRIVNYALQANFGNLAASISRIIVNTVFGFFGVADVAAKFGIDKKDTNFNSTLKKWGVPSGPYVVLPVLGPSSLRYVMSLIVDWPISSISKKITCANNITYYGLTCLNLLSKRSAYGDMIRYVTSTTTDKYKTFKKLTMSMEK